MTKTPDSSTFLVQTAEQWGEVNDLLQDFADGIVREFGLVAGENVDGSGVLAYAGYPTLIVHTQMQGAVGTGGTSARLEFNGVRRVTFDHERNVSPAISKPLDDGMWEVELLTLRIVAEVGRVMVTGSTGLGEGPFVIQR